MIPDFTIGPRFTAEAAVRLVLQRFPELAEVAGSSDDLYAVAPFSTFEALGSLTIERISEVEFAARICKFVQELLMAKDPLLENALTVSFFERVAAIPEVSRALKDGLDPEGMLTLSEVERDVYGR